MALGDVAAAMAERAGLPVRGFYTVAETSRYSGFSKDTLYGEIRAGHLRKVTPHGRERKTYISVAELDRWAEERQNAQGNEDDAPGEVPQGAEHKTQDIQVSCIG